MEIDKVKRWRLILGEQSENSLQNVASEDFSLTEEERILDEALAAIYDETNEGFNGRGSGKGKSSIKLAKWLTDIRSYFNEDIVSVIQADAIERKGLKQLLLEPETLKSVKPDIGMVSTLMSLKGSIPEKAKESARMIVKSLVDEINKKLENDIKKAVTGALNKRQHSVIPQVSSIDWKLTISRNLKNYNLSKKTIIPDRFYFFDRANKSNNWTVIVDMDQSGSMADSIIYASIMGSIFASINSLKTRIVAFDTNVVDLTETCANDPVDMIFGVQLGGGTDINLSVKYCQQFIENPEKTIFILISDLYELGNRPELIQRMTQMHESKVKIMCLLALSDNGCPSYDTHIATRLTSIGIPCFAASPNVMPEIFEGALKGLDLVSLSKKIATKTV